MKQILNMTIFSRKTMPVVAVTMALTAVTYPGWAQELKQELKVAGAGVGIASDEDGNVTIQSASGQPLLTIGNYRLTWVPGETDGGIASYFTAPTGERGIQVVYRTKNSAAGDLKIQSQFVPKNGKVSVNYDIWGSDDLNTKGPMLDLKPEGASTGRQVVRLGKWVRDSGGGVPYLTPDTAGLYYNWPSQSALVHLEDANTTWLGDNTTHFPAKKVGDGHFVAKGQIAVTAFAASPLATAAKFGDRNLALEIRTDKAYNIWDDNKQPLVVHAQSSNLSDKAALTNLKWWVRDFQGKVVNQGEKTQNVAANSAWDAQIPVNAPATGMLFMEVQAQSGGETVFRRTNLAVIPPHKFADPSDSLFGISAFFNQPSRDETLGLLQRIGVRWLRGSDRYAVIPQDHLQKYGIAQNFAEGFVPEDKKFSDDLKYTSDWLKQKFKEAETAKAPYWEIGNEWNMVGGIGKAVHAKQYADKVLTLADAARREINSPVKIMSQGLAGGDLEFIDAMYEAGVWDKFDAFALHPGRGNFTADYDGKPTTPGDGTQFWTFLGSIRNVKEKLAKYGDKPLFLTEAYACTQENITWYDTYRHAAENVVLSYALAKAEGVQMMNWYQLNDSVWHNPGGVSDTDSEYHYGLINLDLSPKPSLLAYRNIAMALDGARFVRGLNFGNTATKGLLFDTPQGPMSVLWNRADGYELNKNHPQNEKRFRAPEVWIDDWATKTKVMLGANGHTVRELDCIGQEKSLAANGGQVEVTLDGAPRIYYGLSPEIGK